MTTKLVLLVAVWHFKDLVGASLDLVLAPCDIQDSFQLWNGSVLSHPGAISPVKSAFSELCFAVEADSTSSTLGGGPIGLTEAACGKQGVHPDDGTNFVLRDNGQLHMIGDGRCLDAGGGYGAFFGLWDCHPPGSQDYLHQRFVVKASGLLESMSSPGFCIAATTMELPRLQIRPGSIISAGGSSGGDMAIQFHVAFSASVSAVCGHDAQPYHCAVQRFAADNLVPATPESGTPHCSGCPPNMTLIYDHCKNHPEWVDVGQLPDYPRRIGGAIDDVANLSDTYVYLSRSECETYKGGAEVNTQAMYAMMTTLPDKQILYRDQCAPGRGSIDVDEECLGHVLGPGSKAANKTGSVLQPPAVSGKRNNSRAFRQAAFLDDFNLGF
ncbi:unnamed protein product, partial [Polarella glacialis]